MEHGFHSTLETRKNVWIPKSVIITEEEYNAQIESERKAIKSGLEYNEALLAYCKAHKVKGVRKGMRTVTMINKLTEAGIEVPARA